MLIVGGGVAGLAAAITLRRAGFDVQVFERRAAIASEGAGIQLGPNATRMLRLMGVADEMSAAASVPHAILVHRGIDGRRLTTLPLGDAIAARHGAPYWVLHRMDLVRALHAAALRAGATIHFGVGIERVEANCDSARLTLSNGRVIRGAAVIGADGLWSTVRAQAFDGDTVTSTGLVAARGIVTSGLEFLRRDAVSVWMAPDVHLVAYPIHGGRALNIVLIAPGVASGERWSGDVSMDEMRQRLSGTPGSLRFSAALQDLAGAAAPWRQWPLVTRPPLTSFARGRIVLIGDAAHPMMPFLAQGGAMALEDAVVLGTELAVARAYPTGDPATAFARFSARRLGRTHRVVAAARRNGRLYHLSGAAAMVRNAALGAAPGSMVMRGYDWLYGERTADGMAFGTVTDPAP